MKYIIVLRSNEAEMNGELISHNVEKNTIYEKMTFVNFNFDYLKRIENFQIYECLFQQAILLDPEASLLIAERSIAIRWTNKYATEDNL